MTDYPITISHRRHPRSETWPVRHPYVELCWLPILGPSSVALLRLVPLLLAEACPLTIDRNELAHLVGLGRGSRLPDTCHRLAKFGHVDWNGRDLAVPLGLPSLTVTQLSRVPERVVRSHEDFLAKAATK